MLEAVLLLVALVAVNSCKLQPSAVVGGGVVDVGGGVILVGGGVAVGGDVGVDVVDVGGAVAAILPLLSCC